MDERFETFTVLINRINRNIRKIKNQETGAKIGKKIADKIAYFLKEISIELTEEERLQFYRSLTLISKGLDNIANKRV